MTTRELGLAYWGVDSIIRRHSRSVVTLGLTLLGFLVGESSGQRIETGCTSCREVHIPGAGTAVRGLDPSGSYSLLTQGMAAPSHDPWLVEAGWSGAYYAPQY
jgi:ATP-dependent phosphoenolpyruvate carboxykinase